MQLKPWKMLSQSNLHQNKWWTYRRDEFKLPNGKPGEYHYVHTNGSSMVIPVAADGRIILVKQHRYLCRRDSVEFPCGGVKDHSSHDETAQQELAEETGYSAKRWIHSGEFNPFNGVTDEMCRVYIAKDLCPVRAAPDETEEFVILLMTPEEINQNIRSGEIWDGMTIAAWTIARAKGDV